MFQSSSKELTVGKSKERGLIPRAVRAILELLLLQVHFLIQANLNCVWSLDGQGAKVKSVIGESPTIFYEPEKLLSEKKMN